MSDRHLEDDLALLPFLRDEERLSRRSAVLRPHAMEPATRSARHEQMEDALRASEVATAWRRAASAPPGPGGEASRRRFRLLARPYLERAAAEQRAELDACRDTLEIPDHGFADPIAAQPDPQRRRALYSAWVEAEARLTELRAEHAAAASAAARAAGADSLFDLLGGTHPGAADALEGLSTAYEAATITPLDDAIERAARDRRLRSPLPLIQPEHPADSPAAELLAGYEERCPASGIPPVLRALGGALGLDPDAGGPGVLRDASVCASPRTWVTRRGSFVLIGSREGPAAWGAALTAFGRMARRDFVVTLRGAAQAAAADPAFDAAAGVLFGRLLLSRAFRGRFGPRPHDGMDADLRLQSALAPRLSWTYLYLAIDSRGREGDPRAGEVQRGLRRALGRPATVDQELVPFACDPAGAAELRGTVLALLLEERLLSRWGTEWFVTGAAGRFLRECWEAEDGQTADGVADDLDLGTIEPTPILDGCRP